MNKNKVTKKDISIILVGGMSLVILDLVLTKLGLV